MRIESYYRPHRSSPKILEPEPNLRQLGGTFWVYLYNPKRRPRHISALELNQQPLEALSNGRGVNWFRVEPEPVPANGLTLLIVNLQASLLQRLPLRLELLLADGERVESLLVPETSPLTLTYAWLEGRTLKVVVRNDDPQREWTLEQLRVAGRTLPFRSPMRTVVPGELTFVTATLRSEPSPHQSLPLQMNARSGSAQTMTGGLVRPLSRHFPLGTWRTKVWDDPAEMERWHSRGFDTFVMSASNDPNPTEQRAFEQTCPQKGVKALVFAGFPRPATRFIERHKENPHIVAYMIKDEPDWAKPEQFDNWHLPTLCERVAKVFRDRAISPPVYLNLARSRRFGEFATTPDIACYDAYRVGAPMPDLSPHEWGNRIELAGTYTEDLRTNCEPLPFWVWAQGAHTWDERVWVAGQLGRACPTPEEIRTQLWFQLGRGAKGVLWFIGFDENEFRRYYMRAEDIPALKRLPESERAPLVEQLVAQGREAFEEQTRLNLFLQPLRNRLLSMDWQPNAGRVLTATNPQKLDVSVLVGEDALVVWLTNYDYEMAPQGYRFREQAGIEVVVALPRWLNPKRAVFRVPDETREIPFERRRAREVVFQIDRLPQHVGTVWLETR
ncbi:MAG: hypothetical protein SNJ72_08115 [Fimbriimonadales bacterium]